MKKIISFALAVVMVLCLASCGSKDKTSTKKDFEISRKAFENIHEAYEKVDDFSHDIYEAWYLGINEKSDIDGTYTSAYYTHYNDREELGNLANKLYISREDLEQAVAKLLGKSEYDPGGYSEPGDWYTLSNEVYDSFFSACVEVVSTAYEMNGRADEIKGLLVSARDKMKELSDKYSDYEHYPALKEYFTTTTAFFGFCIDPEGSFEQVVETFNNYRNEARDCYYDLNYVFVEEMFATEEENKDNAESL